MKHAYVKGLAAVVALSAALLPAPARAELAQCYPKVNNFVLFVDQSGSMYQRYGESEDVKAVAAKTVLRQLNAVIPELDYKGSLYMFAPFTALTEPQRYFRFVIDMGIDGIPDSQPVATRLTTMTRGYQDLRPVVGGLSGKTAVIMFSDGGDNGGGDPVESAREMLAGRPDVCLHVVSFADTDRGHEVNTALSKIGQGCRLVEGSDLARDPVKREQFVRDVFCTEAPAKAKQRIVLRGVNFDFDKAVIRPEGRPIIEEAVRTLKEQPSIKISIEGHTDSIGSEAYNQKLSERRADAVADALGAGGIARSRMSTIGFGKLKPVASNATEDGRAQNRRVEFRVIDN